MTKHQPRFTPHGDLLRWHQTTGLELFTLHQQTITIVSPCLSALKLPRGFTRKNLGRKVDALLWAVERLRIHLDALASLELRESCTCEIYWPALANIKPPPLLAGVPPQSAQILAVNHSERHKKIRQGLPPGYLDEADIGTLRSFFFVEVRDTFTQIARDIESRRHSEKSATIIKKCAFGEQTAFELVALLDQSRRFCR